MDNPRLIDANVLRKRIEERIQEFDKETSAASAFMGYDLDDVLDYIDTTPTIALETDAQYWHNPETDPPKVETEVLILYRNDIDGYSITTAHYEDGSVFYKIAYGIGKTFPIGEHTTRSETTTKSRKAGGNTATSTWKAFTTTR
jgi:hypothetical protein